MKTLLRRVFGPSKRELRGEIARLDTVIHEKNQEIGRLRVKAEEGDALLCREIDKLNDELDGLNHKFATTKFENDRLVGENSHLIQLKEKLFGNLSRLADEKERLRLNAVELHENIERLQGQIDQAVATSDVSLDQRDEAYRERDDLRSQVKSLADQLAAANVEKTGYEAEASGLNHCFDAIDTEICNALEAVGKAPPKPAGAPDRVDVICRAVVELHAENHRLTRMMTEPEFLRAESQRVGGIVTTSADLKHCAARVMVQSFAASLEGDRAIMDPENWTTG